MEGLASAGPSFSTMPSAVVVVDHGLDRALREYPHLVNILMKDATDEIGEHMQSLAQRYAPRRTGNLIGAINYSVYDNIGDDFFAVVSIDEARAPYASYVESGTGIYGPRRAPYTGHHGNMMYFYSERFGRIITKRVIQGQKGVHFMERAWLETETTYVPMRLARLEAELEALL